MKKSVKKTTSELSEAASTDVRNAGAVDGTAAKSTKSTKRTSRKVAETATRKKTIRKKTNIESAAENVLELSEVIDDKSDASIAKKMVKKATKTAKTTKIAKKTLKKAPKKSSVATIEAASKASSKKTAKIQKKSSAEKVEQESAPVVAESDVLDELNAVFSGIELSDAERERRTRRELEKARFQPSSVELTYSRELPPWEPGWLLVRGARQNNLKSIDVPFPLSAFSVVVGVSGSGKSSLVDDVLYRTLARRLNRSQTRLGACDEVLGVERLSKVVRVDQAPIGLTPTSNAATYSGVFDLIRQLYSELPESKLRGYSPRRFSFNVPGGRCEKCEGAGQLKVEMHFLADVWVVCDACDGKRYDAETLQVKYRGKSISDALDSTCADALKLFERIPPIARILRTLCDVGLDYLTLGQSATTLSGGEAQRVKLAAELARVDSGRTLYILDEPTTGLHFDDVQKLLEVLHRLVDLGNTVVVVEHNLDVVKNADWIVEIGPDAGLEGGRLVYAGLPEGLLEYSARWSASPELQKSTPRSFTGEALIPVFLGGTFAERPVLDKNAYLQSQKGVAFRYAQLAEELAEETSDSSTTVNDEKIENVEETTVWDSDAAIEQRACRTGAPCRWDERILDAVVERLEKERFLAEADRSNRSIVEIRAENKSFGWFFQANVAEEWLLKLKFRTVKNTFEKESTIRKLALKTLSEMQEIPLFGTMPRVKLETVGAWQEVELKVFSFEEVNRPEFWEFVDRAVERFGAAVERAKEDELDLTPWKTQGRDWHSSLSGFYGDDEKPRWPFDILDKIFEIVATVSRDSEPIWTNKIVVPYFKKDAKRPWCQIYTKNCDALCVRVDVPKGSVSPERVEKIGFEQEIDVSNDEYDAVYLRFRTKKEFDSKALRVFLKETVEKIAAETDAQR